MSEHKRKLPDSDIESDKPKGASASSTKGKPKKGGDVGRALRSVYDSTLNEDIPDDFLDLLGKLG